MILLVSYHLVLTANEIDSLQFERLIDLNDVELSDWYPKFETEYWWNGSTLKIDEIDENHVAWRNSTFFAHLASQKWLDRQRENNSSYSPQNWPTQSDKLGYLGASLLIRTKDQKILLGQRSAMVTFGKGTIELAANEGMEMKDTDGHSINWRKAMQRAAKEEIGLDLDLKDFRPLGLLADDQRCSYSFFSYAEVEIKASELLSIAQANACDEIDEWLCEPPAVAMALPRLTLGSRWAIEQTMARR